MHPYDKRLLKTMGNISDVPMPGTEAKEIWRFTEYRFMFYLSSMSVCLSGQNIPIPNFYVRKTWS